MSKKTIVKVILKTSFILGKSLFKSTIQNRDDVVKLTLIDYKYSESRIGFYSASSILTLSNSKFSVLENPSEEYATQQNDVD